MKQAKDALVQRLANDPQFSGWYDDYLNFGSSRTSNAIEVITAAVSDPQFMADNGGTSLWQTAKVYLAARQQVIDGTLNADQWEIVRNQLVDASPSWATIANRYLNSDDDPKAVGVSFATMGVSNG